jgi:hypothetical protein
MFPTWIRWAYLSTGFGVLAISNTSYGVMVTFDYAGSVVFGGGTVFGITIGEVAVEGQLTVETSAAMTHDFGGGRLGFHQTLPGGFTVTFETGAGSIEVSVDEYLVVIGNDVLSGNADSVEFLFQSDLVPRLATPLVIDGIARKQGDYNGNGVSNEADFDEWKAQFGLTDGSADGSGNGIVDAADYTVWRDGGPTGFLSIEFLTGFGGQSLFSSSSLASADLANNLNATNFSSIFNRFGDTPQAPDVFFDLYSFSLSGASASRVPEPGPSRMLAPIAFLLLVWRRHV